MTAGPWNCERCGSSFDRYKAPDSLAPRFCGVSCTRKSSDDAWPDDRIAKLKKLWHDGLSASQIAAEFDVSRNAVIGKLYRLGLSRADQPTKPAKTPAPRTTKHRVLVGPKRTVQYAERVYPPPSMDDNAIPVGQRRTLLELTAETCHWPIGHPGEVDFFFCGGPPTWGYPYCAHHMLVAYQRPSAAARAFIPQRRHAA